MQQPWQFDASHLPVLQVPDFGSQSRPCCAQFVQFPPKRPHAVGSAPARQISTPPLRSQHPLQFAQPVRLHVFESPHVSNPFARQSEQRLPCCPHARVSLPRRHWPALSQHPVGHVCGLQPPGGGGVIVPPSSDSDSRLDRPQPGTRTTKMIAARAAVTIKRTSEDRRIGEPRFRILA